MKYANTERKYHIEDLYDEKLSPEPDTKFGITVVKLTKPPIQPKRDSLKTAVSPDTNEKISTCKKKSEVHKPIYNKTAYNPKKLCKYNQILMKKNPQKIDAIKPNTAENKIVPLNSKRSTRNILVLNAKNMLVKT